MMVRRQMRQLLVRRKTVVTRGYTTEMPCDVEYGKTLSWYTSRLHLMAFLLQHVEAIDL